MLLAIGRTGGADKLNLDAAGIKWDAKQAKIAVDDNDGTNLPHVFAIGDVALGRPELTPVAIQAGKMLVSRFYTGSKKLMDYTNVATTVFTPLEFGTIGYSEDDAKGRRSGLVCSETSFNKSQWMLGVRRTS